MNRAVLEAAIEAAIGLLDHIDGDSDFEPELEGGADDVGEPEGETWLERVA